MEMTDPRNFFYNQDQNYREQHTTRDDFVSFAQANANYCYQLSLWWWNVYNQQHALNQSWNTRFTNQNCECVENDLIIDGACDCCQNSTGFEYVCDTQGHVMDACRDCPQPEPYAIPYWHRPHDERSRSCGNHNDGTYPQNDNNRYGNDNNAEEIDEEDDDGDDGGDDESDVDDDADVDEDSDTNMEVDDNFRKFLEQSEKHRQERERRKQETLKEKDDYIEVGSIHLNTTTCAPSEQPGAKRKKEMKALYGKHTSVIMSLEATLQLNYDKNCDKRQPVFWPSIPLKF